MFVVAAAAIHEALAACPWIVEVLTADDLMSATALWFVEQIVDGLVECGMSLDQAVHGYRAIWYYTAGEIMIRATASRRRADDDRATYRERVFADLDPGELPRLAQVADRWAPLTAEDTYLDGLRALVSGLLTPR
ncbi:TetR/AcrR family transcriptional regulator [Streptomyces collinus]|uniref:Putative transcriptional regulator n=1 Tax=Streptomyces collinus (strain DSM 40733 / Tue 365) TaxID=1214242 RepID=S5VB71_STRC3|nr:putative transcriptional regulator [Streptomyces collinus Tu 365]UJA11029.1 TetR/AcrR family transcriptional regulator [Streptomyces collinus]UJA14107.1 TetR/AcrR family transcriptional regulator [Streptomyces collinus]